MLNVCLFLERCPSRVRRGRSRFYFFSLTASTWDSSCRFQWFFYGFLLMFHRHYYYHINASCLFGCLLMIRSWWKKRHRNAFSSTVYCNLRFLSLNISLKYPIIIYKVKKDKESELLHNSLVIRGTYSCDQDEQEFF